MAPVYSLHQEMWKVELCAGVAATETPKPVMKVSSKPALATHLAESAS